MDQRDAQPATQQRGSARPVDHRGKVATLPLGCVALSYLMQLKPQWAIGEKVMAGRWVSLPVHRGASLGGPNSSSQACPTKS